MGRITSVSIREWLYWSQTGPFFRLRNVAGSPLRFVGVETPSSGRLAIEALRVGAQSHFRPIVEAIIVRIHFANRCPRPALRSAQYAVGCSFVVINKGRVWPAMRGFNGIANRLV
jgi:hypothetical protein